jgi:hypothetical protein
LGGSTFDLATYNRFQKNLANGRPNEWHCGAGARYLYVCETDWSTGARSNAGILAFRWSNTVWQISSASIGR